jgi:hypothetical protein
MIYTNNESNIKIYSIQLLYNISNISISYCFNTFYINVYVACMKMVLDALKRKEQQEIESKSI